MIGDMKDYMPAIISSVGALVLVATFYFTVLDGTIPGMGARNNTPDANQTTGQIAGAAESVQNPHEMVIDQENQYTATLQTSAGPITMRLNDDQTPITVNNFVTLARDGFYNGTIFHRVIEGFMIQGGDPEGTGAGGPGYRFMDEPFEGEYTRGTVAMANAGPDTNGSQFFIIHQDYDLPPDYVIFGEVIEGIETVDAIATAEVTTSPMGEPSVPVEPVTVETVTITEE